MIKPKSSYAVPVGVQRINDAIFVLVPEVDVLLQNCTVGWTVATCNIKSTVYLARAESKQRSFILRG